MSNIIPEIVHFTEHPFPMVIIRGLFNEEERIKMVKEMKTLKSQGALKGGDKTLPAVDPITGKPKKSNIGVWIDEWYDNLSHSDIFTINRKSFREALINVYEEADRRGDWFFKNVAGEINSDATLISYYSADDYYEAHKDTTLVTILTWFFDTPKQFEGGNLRFPDYDIEIEISNSITVIFPGSVTHEVSRVLRIEGATGEVGRYVMAQMGNQQ